MSKKQSTKTQKLFKQVSKKQASKQIKGPVQTEEQKKERERKQIQIRNHENMINYMKKLQIVKKKEIVETKLAGVALNVVESHIKEGELTVAQNPSQISKLLIDERISKQQKRQRQLKAKRDAIAKKIQFLDLQLRGKIEQKQNQFSIPQVLSKQEHDRRVKEILSEKLERRKQKKQKYNQLKKHEREMDEQKKSLSVLEKSKQLELRRATIQANIQKRKEEHDNFINQQMHSKEILLKKYKSTTHMTLQKKYQTQILMPRLEEQKNRLKELRQFKKRYDVQAVNAHEKQYLQRRQNSLELSKAKLNSAQKIIYEPPKKTNKLSKILAEEQQELRSKLEARKNRIEQMIRMQTDFISELKEKHQPKIDSIKRKQIQERLIEDQKKHVRPDLDKDIKQIGKDYLEIAKKMKRSASERSEILHREELLEESKMQLLKESKNHSIYHFNHQSQQIYQGIRRKKLDQIANSQESKMQKLMRLKIQSDKIDEKMKQKSELMRYQSNQQIQKDTAELILSSIKAKMSIMNLYKK